MEKIPSTFRFKKFSVEQGGCIHAVGTDGVLLGAWARCDGARRILDIGTGTGLLALMVAQRCPNAQITCLDINPEAVARARHNVGASPWAGRIEVLEADVRTFGEGGFDLVVCNPPFFHETTIPGDPHRAMARQAVALSLPELALALKKVLAPEGSCCLILPVREGKRMIELSALSGLYVNHEVWVFTKREKAPERMLLRLSQKSSRYQKGKMILFDQEDRRSEEFAALTGDFYL